MEPVSEKIIQFIELNIETVEQLEILRILAGDREKEWTGATLAREVQTPPETIATHLQALERRGLLTLSPNGLCRYGFRTPELEQAANDLLRLYNERPVTLIRMIYARSNSALKSFADAFRIRKEK